MKPLSRWGIGASALLACLVWGLFQPALADGWRRGGRGGWGEREWGGPPPPRYEYRPPPAIIIAPPPRVIYLPPPRDVTVVSESPRVVNMSDQDPPVFHPAPPAAALPPDMGLERLP